MKILLLQESLIGSLCRSHLYLGNYDYYEPSFEELTQCIKQYKPDILFSIHYSKIIPHEVLSSVRCINLHCAPLPEYRGFNSTLHAILNGELYWGSTIHEMTDKPDEGDIIFKSLFPIPQNITNKQLYSLAVHDAHNLFAEKLDIILSGNYAKTKQEGGHFYAKKDIPSREIKLSMSEFEVSKMIRAFYYPPHEPAYIMYNGVKYYVMPEDK